LIRQLLLLFNRILRGEIDHFPLEQKNDQQEQ